MIEIFEDFHKNRDFSNFVEPLYEIKIFLTLLLLSKFIKILTEI